MFWSWYHLAAASDRFPRLWGSTVRISKLLSRSAPCLHMKLQTMHAWLVKLASRQCPIKWRLRGPSQLYLKNKTRMVKILTLTFACFYITWMGLKEDHRSRMAFISWKLHCLNLHIPARTMQRLSKNCWMCYVRIWEWILLVHWQMGLAIWPDTMLVYWLSFVMNLHVNMPFIASGRPCCQTFSVEYK